MSVRNRSPIMDLPNLKTPDTVDLRLAWMAGRLDPFQPPPERARTGASPSALPLPSPSHSCRGRGGGVANLSFPGFGSARDSLR